MVASEASANLEIEVAVTSYFKCITEFSAFKVNDVFSQRNLAIKDELKANRKMGMRKTKHACIPKWCNAPVHACSKNYFFAADSLY